MNVLKSYVTLALICIRLKVCNKYQSYTLMQQQALIANKKIPLTTRFITEQQANS